MSEEYGYTPAAQVRVGDHVYYQRRRYGTVTEIRVSPTEVTMFLDCVKDHARWVRHLKPEDVLQVRHHNQPTTKLTDKPILT